MTVPNHDDAAELLRWAQGASAVLVAALDGTSSREERMRRQKRIRKALIVAELHRRGARGDHRLAARLADALTTVGKEFTEIVAQRYLAAHIDPTETGGNR